MRVVDFVLALVGMIALAPLFFFVAIVVKGQDGGPVLFRQVRIGRGAKPFELLKFRSMRVGSLGPLITVSGDARITRFGRFLRASKLDELPQLWNVLKGEMSFVGPRPEVKKYVDLYTPEQAKVLNLKPGITDPASLKFIDESSLLASVENPEYYYIHVIMPEKIRINLEYASRRTLWSNLCLIWSTVFRVAHSSGTGK